MVRTQLLPEGEGWFEIKMLCLYELAASPLLKFRQNWSPPVAN
jgi:hypothetical protein